MAKSINRDQSILVISKNPADLNQKDIDDLNKSAADLQPEFNPPLSKDPLDIEISDKINELYRYLGDRDVTFFIGAILPKSDEPKDVYRLTDLNIPEKRAKYHALTAKLGWLLYCFSDKTKVTYWIQSLGWIHVLKDVFPSPPPKRK